MIIDKKKEPLSPLIDYVAHVYLNKKQTSPFTTYAKITPKTQINHKKVKQSIKIKENIGGNPYNLRAGQKILRQDTESLI